MPNDTKAELLTSFKNELESFLNDIRKKEKYRSIFTEYIRDNISDVIETVDYYIEEAEEEDSEDDEREFLEFLDDLWDEPNDEEEDE